MKQRSVELVDRAKVERHFLDRLEERYGIVGYSYEELMSLPREGLFKTHKNTICRMMIGRRLAYVLWNGDQGMLKTALPGDIEGDIISALRSCFPNATRPFAEQVYKKLEEELTTAKRDFSTDKEAARYYHDNYIFANELMFQYKGKELKPIFVCKTIRSILNNESARIKITVAKKDYTKDITYGKTNRWYRRRNLQKPSRKVPAKNE